MVSEGLEFLLREARNTLGQTPVPGTVTLPEAEVTLPECSL